MWCHSCRGLGCSECRPASSLSALVGIVAANQPMAPEHLVCPCNTVWASTAPRPICPHHGRSEFMAPIYFGRADFEGLPAKWPSDTEWKREQFPQAAGTPTPADRQAAIAAHQPVTDAWGVEWVPVPRSEVQ